MIGPALSVGHSYGYGTTVPHSRTFIGTDTDNVRFLRLSKGSQWSPYLMENNAAVYSVQGAASDSTYKVGGGTCALVADRSGQSAVNAVVCNGVASNSITSPTKSVTGNQIFTYDAQLSTWTPASNVTIFSKLSGNDGCELLILTTGVVRLRIGDGASVTNYDTTTGMSAAAFTRRTIIATYVDGGSGTLDVTVNGVALGAQVATAKTLTNAAATATFGMATVIGCVFSTQVGSVYNMNPSASAKLLTNGATFVSGGDTYTLNSSGDLGARVCGARDLVQLTVAKQPAFSTGADGVNILTFDGSNDYVKSAPFSLSQPVSRYGVIKQISWTAVDYIFDGNSTNFCNLIQQTATPNLDIYAGTANISNAGLAVGVRGVNRAIFNGAASQHGINRAVAVVGNAGANAMNGFTLACRGAADLGFANMEFVETLLRSAADDTALQLRIANYFIAKYRITP